MKKSFYSFIAGLALATTFAFSFTVNETDYSLGRVTKIDGYLIFVKSEPAAPHERIGVITAPKIVKDNTLTGMLNLFVKKAKKEYPNADALLFNSSEGMVECQAIKFKK